MEITFINQTEQNLSKKILRVDKLLQFAAKYLNLSKNRELSVVFVNNKMIQKMNMMYRKKDIPTDVLSFSIQEKDKIENAIIFPSVIHKHFLFLNLGDIIISVEKALEQSKKYKHSYEKEMMFLALHGFLHLNGYDHVRSNDEIKMFTLQKEIWKRYEVEEKKI